MTRPVQVEILTYAPTELRQCRHCELVWDQFAFNERVHAEQHESSLPADLQADNESIADWASAARARFGNRLTFRVTDAASVERFFKAVRYRSRTFPTFVVDGQERIAGFDRERLDTALRHRLAAGADRSLASTKGGPATDRARNQ